MWQYTVILRQKHKELFLLHSDLVKDSLNSNRHRQISVQIFIKKSCSITFAGFNLQFFAISIINAVNGAPF